MRIPHSAHVSNIAESAVNLADAHSAITESALNHAERHLAKLDAMRKQRELDHAVQHGAENMAR